MKWPEISEIEKTVPFPDGCTGRKLRRSDIPLLIESTKKWYPDVAVGAAGCYLKFGEALRRAMSTGFIYAMCTLKIPHMQLAFERAGYRLLDFAPGYDREVVSPGVVKRVFEAYYAKILVPRCDLLIPNQSNLRPKTLALFQSMFPDLMSE